MRRPPTKTLILGHPIIALPMTLSCVITVIAAIHAGSPAGALVVLPIWGMVHAASERATAYYNWKREWDALGPEKVPRPSIWRQLLVLMLVGALAVAILTSDRTTQFATLSVGGLLLCATVILAVLTRMVRAIARRRRFRAGAFAVKVVARRGGKAPTLAAAYGALPPYCQALLRGRP